MSRYGRDNIGGFDGVERDYIAACANAFDGGDIQIEAIEPGMFWEAIRALRDAGNGSWGRSRTLLDKLGVE